MTILSDETTHRSTVRGGPLARLLNDECRLVGGVYELDYARATVLTDDRKKHAAGGVPQGAYLLAAECVVDQGGYRLADEELIVLRVRGVDRLPDESELTTMRIRALQEADTGGEADVTDLSDLARSAFACDVIGTFWTDPGTGQVRFGADLDNVVASARYRVFLPSRSTLEWLASYPEPTEDADLLEIGKVRFSATRRRAAATGLDGAAVRVHVSDFLGRKTAVLGMTRAGKSSTIKTLVTAVHRHGSLTGGRVGQLIFDPQGEYAEVNEQDGTALRLIGDADTVRIYRMHADDSDPQVRPLGMNFFDLSKLATVSEFVNDAVSRDYGAYAYVKDFVSIDWSEPKDTDVSGWAAWSRARVGLYGLLALCGFKSPGFADPAATRPGLTFIWSSQEFDEFNGQYPGLVTPPSGGNRYRLDSPYAAARVTLFMAEKGSWNTAKGNDADVRPFSFITTALKRAALKSTVRTLKDFHSPYSDRPVEEQVWEDMVSGRLAIVDLSRGTGDIPRIISENIVTYLLRKESERFVSGSCVPVQVVVEEAHTLFDRSSSDVAGNPWVRLAKEAAKYRVGLLYATQEVTSVDRRILANTSNWLIAHLNSDRETAELSHYYDFGAYADSLRRVDDVGLVRMKTYSGRYVVPVQVAKFDHDMIERARDAAGLLDPF